MVSPSKSCSEGQQRLHFVWKDLQGVWQQQASTSVCDGNEGEESIITLYTTYQSLLFFLYQLYTCLHSLFLCYTYISKKHLSSSTCSNQVPSTSINSNNRCTPTKSTNISGGISDCSAAVLNHTNTHTHILVTT